MSNEVSKKAGKAVAWSSVTEIVNKLIAPLVSMVLARLLTPEAFGAVATVNMVITFAEIFTDAGFQKYIVQHEFESEEELDRGTNVAFWTNFGISALLVSLIVIFRDQLAVWVGSPGLGGAIAVASLNIIAVSFSSIQRARFRRAFDFKTLFFVRVTTTLIPLVITVPLAFIFRNFWALIIGTLMKHVFDAAILTINSKWKPRFFYDFTLFRKMFSFTAWTLLESITIWLTTNIDIFILAKVLNDYYLGIYKVSGTTIVAYMTLITSSLLPVLFAALSRYQDDDENFNRTYWLFFRYSSLLLIPMGIGVFVYRDLVRTILLGAQWEEATLYLGLAGLANGITIPLTYLPSEVYRSKGNPKLSMLAQAVLIISLIPLVLISSKYGFEVLYIVRTFGVCGIGVITHMLLMRFVYGFKVSQTINTTLPFFLSSIVMAAAGKGFIWLSGFMTNKLAMIWQAFSVFLCIMIYFCILFVFFPKIRQEVLEAPFVKKLLMKLKVVRKKA